MHEKNEIKDGLQYTNKKLSLTGDVIVYAWYNLYHYEEARLLELFLENKSFWILKI